jgi:NAD(P)H-dependent flavin oxidoreductase YrpB (nitropropane dioxygenase family)
MLASGNARTSWRSTRVAQQLGIDYPMSQAPFGGLPSQRLTATVSNLGGLGSLGAVTLGSSAISEVIAEIRSLTGKPFAINLGRTAQSQRAHRNVAAERWPGGRLPRNVGDPPRRGRPPRAENPVPSNPERAYVSAVEVARCP